MKPRILVVDDEETLREHIRQFLSLSGHEVCTACSGEEALDVLKREEIDLVLLDKNMPGKYDGIETLSRIVAAWPCVPVIMLTGEKGIKTVIQAIRSGAFYYLTKPFEFDELLMLIELAMEQRKLKLQLNDLNRRYKVGDLLGRLKGVTPSMEGIREAIRRVAPTNYSVVITGQSGTGKEIVAKLIHECSDRASGPWIPVDCGAIAETLVESEFFGYEKGAFTGANARRDGFFERADKGTLFLDEIHNLSIAMQGKLLRVLQEKAIQRVGGARPIEIDVRIIAATNAPLLGRIKSGEFREDLFYRLEEFSIIIPPLKERVEDIDYLAGFFLLESKEELGRLIDGFSPEAIALLERYTWPGNVRQLKNVVRRAALLCSGRIEASDIRIPGFDPSATTGDAEPSHATDTQMPLREIVQRAVEAVENRAIRAVLKEVRGNKSKAARQLEVDYKTMLTKITKYGIDPLDP